MKRTHFPPVKALVTATMVLLSAAVLVPTTMAQDVAADSQPIIDEVVIEGGVTLTIDTVAYYLGLEAGDPLDMEMIEEGYRRLWDSGLFESLRIEVEPLEEGRVRLFVTVTERPFVSAVVFEGNKKLTANTIKDKLDERRVDLPRNVPLRLSEIERIQTALEEVYREEGFQSAEISYELEQVSRTERRVVFNIREGGKVKIKEIEFAGNEVFSDGRLRGAMKKVKEKRLWRPWGKKIIFSKVGWEEDKENLRKFYMNHGYKDVKIGTPELEMVAKRPDAETLKKKKFRMHVTIPVEEGEPYDIGELRVTGTEVFDGDVLRKVFEVSPGDRYSYKAVEDGMETIRNLYHNRGYIYAYTNEVLQDREDEDYVVDVTVDVFEGDRYRLGRLEFSGNTTTMDKVLRREFLVPEGSWMNMGSFRRSVFKVNALGYFKLEEDPLEFDFDEENKRVNVVVKGEEVGRNDIQFGAGYSERDGFFGQVQFNTRNFLGRGEILGVSLQTGRRADFYQLNFTEPFLFDRRILLGGSVFKTNIDIQDFYRETTGASVSLGFGLRVFDSLTFLASYEDVLSRFTVARTGGIGGDLGGHQRPIGLRPTDGEEDRLLNFEEFAGTITAFTPGYLFDSRDDPFDPNRGRRITLRARFAGGPFGGDFDYIRPELGISMFKPVTKRTIFAFNIEAGQFYTYDDSDIPIYERYRLGGDRSLRGIPYYTVVPIDADGSFYRTEGGSLLGGDRYWLLNLEYQFRLGGPVKLVLFTDLGNTYHEDQGWEMGEYRHTAGVELRVFLPVFQAPLRFIYGYNLDPLPTEESSDFQFSIGTTF